MSSEASAPVQETQPAPAPAVEEPSKTEDASKPVEVLPPPPPSLPLQSLIEWGRQEVKPTEPVSAPATTTEEPTETSTDKPAATTEEPTAGAASTTTATEAADKKAETKKAGRKSFGGFLDKLRKVRSFDLSSSAKGELRRCGRAAF